MNSIKVGNIVKGEVTGVTPYGVFVSLQDEYSGLVHISEVSNKYIRDLEKLFNIGDIINVKIIDLDENKSHAKLSIKKIDYRVEKELSMIPESGTGFGLLSENLPRWTSEKYNKIKKMKKCYKKC